MGEKETATAGDLERKSASIPFRRESGPGGEGIAIGEEGVQRTAGQVGDGGEGIAVADEGVPADKPGPKKT